MFEKINTTITISPGDVMAATCRYDSSDVDHDVGMGLVVHSFLTT
jgi:hypothetical protein